MLFISTTICIKVGIILFILLCLKVKTQVFLQLWKFFIISLNIASSTTPSFFPHGTCIMPVYFSVFLHYNCSFIVGISIYVLYSGWITQDCFPVPKVSIQMCLDFILCYLLRIYPILLSVATFHSKFSIWVLLYLPTLILWSLLCFIVSCLIHEKNFSDLPS